MSNSYVGRHRAVIPHRQVGRHRVTRPSLHGWTPWLRWAAVNERTNHAQRLVRNLTSVLGFLRRFADGADDGHQRTLSGKVGQLATTTRRVHPDLSRQRRPADLTEYPRRPPFSEPRARWRAVKPIESSAVHATGEPHHQRDRSRARGPAYAGALAHATSVGAP
jgi:hypothetical protein